MDDVVFLRTKGSAQIDDILYLGTRGPAQINNVLYLETSSYPALDRLYPLSRPNPLVSLQWSYPR
jgi:hypothetical protein